MSMMESGPRRSAGRETTGSREGGRRQAFFRVRRLNHLKRLRIARTISRAHSALTMPITTPAATSVG